MNAVVAPDNRYETVFSDVHPVLPGSGLAWLDNLRRGALARFTELGIPGPHVEDWKYTRLTGFERHDFRVDGGVRISAEDVTRHRLEAADSHLLVFINGRYSAEHSRVGDLPQGVVLQSLSEALAQRPERVEALLGQEADFRNSAFTALNTAFLSDGLYLELPPNAVLATPIHALFLGQSAGEEHMATVRNLLVAGANSQASVIEHYAVAGENPGVYFTNTVTEICAGPGAVLKHCKLQEEGDQAYHVGSLYVDQAADSRFIAHQLSLGARLSRHEVSPRLREKGADCTLNGLYLAGGRQHVDNHVRMEHAAAHTDSRQYYRGVLDGRSRGVFTGRVVVRPDAQKINADQSDRNLLLSPKAEADTRPQLEIYADDVKCSHGATVGQIDETALFYLRSRGLDETTARNLLTYAFASEVIDRIELTALRTKVGENLAARLPQGDRIRELL